MIRTLLALPLVLPSLAFAQTATTKGRDFAWLVNEFLSIIDILVIGVFALAFVLFLWGVTKAWIIKGGSEDGVKEGKQFVTAALIGFVVMASVWGIVRLLAGIFY